MMRTLKDFANEDSIFEAVARGDITEAEFRNLWQEIRQVGYSEGYDEGWEAGLDQGRFNWGP
jgi:flagellar biosynthesis/type III secretory pathway protein FliH